ncbi:hypothetical protein SAMN02745163_01466 [Clostridium cavendishii DSM 21758]|uniref:Uncharacterized protein n=1 Tax=Clostridium cavendishii DSM 21758 TaxID=1121302 RepID=A0A1M6H2W0_9CLOT|nr:hypothetical protein SAMN02745163_01466 [Clostridium cavendishii DSM 21758]
MSKNNDFNLDLQKVKVDKTKKNSERIGTASFITVCSICK